MNLGQDIRSSFEGLSTRSFPLLALLILCGFRPAAAQGGCPADHVQGRQATQGFFTSPQYAEIRRRLSIHSGAESVRPLTVRDSAACSRLNALFGDSRYTRPPYHRSYYTAGGFYFVVFRQEREPGARFTMGHSPLVILDSDFKTVSVT